MNEPELLSYATYRPHLRDLDVIAFEGRGLISRAIRRVTGGTVTHVGLILRWGGSVYLIESRELKGHRVVWLSREIMLAGSVLLYRSRDLLDDDAAQAAVEWARRAAGAPYSYRGLIRMLRRLPLTGWAFSWLPDPDRDSLGYGPRFCSAFVSAVLRLARADPREDLSDAATTPADLVASPRLRLVGRLEVVPQ